jgi:hypothetical protein
MTKSTPYCLVNALAPECASRRTRSNTLRERPSMPESLHTVLQRRTPPSTAWPQAHRGVQLAITATVAARSSRLSETAHSPERGESEYAELFGAAGDRDLFLSVPYRSALPIGVRP